MIRYCILSIPRSGSTWLLTGIGHMIRNLSNYINLQEFNVPSVEPHSRFELDDNNYIRKYIDDVPAEIIDPQGWHDNRVNLIHLSNPTQPCILKYMIWHSYRSVNYNDFNNLKKIQDNNVVIINLDRDPFDCSISREVSEITGITHHWFFNRSKDKEWWHTTNGPKDKIENPRVNVNVDDFKVNYMEYLMTYNLKQQIAADLKCKTIRFNNLREDCLLNKIPFHYHSHAAKLYDEDYSDIITNYKDLLEIRDEVNIHYATKTI